MSWRLSCRSKREGGRWKNRGGNRAKGGGISEIYGSARFFRTCLDS